MDKKNDHTTPAQTPATARPFAKKRDLIVIGAILLVAAAAFLFFMLTRTTGAVAEITISGTKGNSVQTIALSKDGIYDIEGGSYPVTLEIADGAVRFINSQCPDHLCEGFGWLRYQDEYAICIPAGVWVRVVENP
ncbi:MAG: NusG domain II-containing protein [Oscillospiraceae bacterium]